MTMISCAEPWHPLSEPRTDEADWNSECRLGNLGDKRSRQGQSRKTGGGRRGYRPYREGKVYFSLLPQQSRYGLPEPHGQGELGFGLLAMVVEVRKSLSTNPLSIAPG